MLNEYAEALEAQYAVLFPVACHTLRSRSPMCIRSGPLSPVERGGFVYA
jgi:hypothetical protein